MADGRRPIIAANWKMHKTHLEAIRDVQKLAYLLDRRDTERVEVVVSPAFTALRSVETLIESDRLAVALGAQDVHWEGQGAFTGEISAPMLLDVAARAVIVGHSERRELFGEKDALVARKTRRAVEAGLLPIVCVGETKEERDAGGMWEKVSGQVRRVMEELDGPGGESVVFAYEPIWAIGTGETATPGDAQDAIAKIRDLLRELEGDGFASAVRILYGGSVKPTNAAEIMAQEDVDGALVGGASLEVESFMELVEAARETVASE